MDSNKDEALRCIEVAERYIQEKNKEKAKKFLQKAERLFPTERAKDLLLKVSIMPDSVQTEQPKRKTSLPRDASPKKLEYTTAQIQLVKRIRACKDYYEILCVSKDASDSEIKKAYKKIALQLHPDKNRAPGADEAFKAVGNAVAVLTDIEKRKQYDLYGNDEQVSTHRQTYNRGFEPEVSPDELFNMFFGGGFGSNVYIRRNGRWQRRSSPERQQEHLHNHRRHNTDGGSMPGLIQLLPIIIAILLSMLSGIFISDPPYSLTRTAKYPIERRTYNLQIPYFVKQDFHTEYQGSVKRLELTVEEEYLQHLRHLCQREKTYQGAMEWKARQFKDEKMLNDAKNMKLPSCDELKVFIKV